MIRKRLCKKILHGSRPSPYIPYCQLCQQSSLGFCYNLWQSTIRDNNNIISNVSTVYSFLKLYYIITVYPHQLDPVLMMAGTTNTQLGSLSHVPVRTDSLRVFLWGHAVISCSLACNTWAVRAIHCLLPTADLQPWRLSVCHFLVEAEAASSYLDNFCSRFPIACAAANDHPWHMDIDERNALPENSSSKHHGTVRLCCRLFVAPDICG